MASRNESRAERSALSWSWAVVWCSRYACRAFVFARERWAASLLRFARRILDWSDGEEGCCSCCCWGDVVEGVHVVERCFFFRGGVVRGELGEGLRLLEEWGGAKGVEVVGMEGGV